MERAWNLEADRTEGGAAVMLWRLAHTSWDAERAECAKAGAIGHILCGMCRHGLPMLMCFNAGGNCWRLSTADRFCCTIANLQRRHVL